jgi:hypothetical protein
MVFSIHRPVLVAIEVVVTIEVVLVDIFKIFTGMRVEHLHGQVVDSTLKMLH